MDVNQVRFGNYTIGNSQANLGKKEDSKEGNVQQQIAQENNLPKINADDFFNAMNIAGLQNKAQISVAKKEVNPADFLSQERISDIEAMMGNFDSGVNQIADTIENEFPGLFAPDNKLALAAKIFADQE